MVTPAPAAAGVERFVIDPSASAALYHVGETFFNRNNQFVVAVGTTHGIQGQILKALGGSFSWRWLQCGW